MTKQETNTGKELAAFSLWQDGMHIDGKAPKEQFFVAIMKNLYNAPFEICSESSK